MNEKVKAVEIKKDFDEEYSRTLKMLMETYPRVSRVKKDDNLTEDVFTISIYTILNNMLKQVQIDSTLLSISEFHSKYVPNLPILYRDDFTCDEFKEIIESSYLKEKDKQIAYKYFVERKSTGDIYAELDDLDRKTISSHLDDINNALLYRACRYNKKNNN